MQPPTVCLVIFPNSSVQLGENPRFVRPAPRLAAIFGRLAAHHHRHSSWNKLLSGPGVEPWGTPLQEGLQSALRRAASGRCFELLLDFLQDDFLWASEDAVNPNCCRHEGNFRHRSSILKLFLACSGWWSLDLSPFI